MLRGALAIFLSLWLSLSGALGQGSVWVPSTTSTTPISISTATTTLLISGLTGLRTYITNFNVIAAGTGNIQLIAGTGSSCGGSTVNLTGNYNLIAQTGIVLGTGNGTVLVAGLGFNVCAVTSSPVGMAGSIASAQF